MYSKILVLLLIAVAATSGNVDGWTDCGSHLAIVYRMRIAGCQNTPCTFVRGQSYLIEVDASSRANSYTLPFASVASFLGMDLTLMEGDACDNLRVGSCPARIGQPFTFSVIFEVPQLLPPISTTVTTIVFIDTGDVGVCVRVPIIVR